MQFAILDSCANQESRIKSKLLRISSQGSSLNCRTENKRLTHEWFLDNFTKTYSCNTTQHGHIHTSNCMLAKRPIQVVKRMFPSSRTSVSSFISSSKVSNACSKCKQCLFPQANCPDYCYKVPESREALGCPGHCSFSCGTGSFYCVNSANMSFWMPRKLSWIMPHAPLQVKFLYFPYLFVQAIERLHVIVCVPVTAVHNS